ncbi:hypothetical protein BS50DRAFT_81536 [Corynespora cassiicola Philippines]|uniref:Uncharacterized protein n=1 Tax=Corynespora cassiicola Philippines TaxID=1448308 RepID=A0A2T2NH69_CORCC|nr:hypothetical protein BS50DRAFT_81536 [Corynespora cassiicola Philippines]
MCVADLYTPDVGRGYFPALLLPIICFLSHIAVYGALTAVRPAPRGTSCLASPHKHNSHPSAGDAAYLRVAVAGCPCYFAATGHKSFSFCASDASAKRNHGLCAVRRRRHRWVQQRPQSRGVASKYPRVPAQRRASNISCSIRGPPLV